MSPASFVAGVVVGAALSNVAWVIFSRVLKDTVEATRLIRQERIQRMYRDAHKGE